MLNPYLARFHNEQVLVAPELGDVVSSCLTALANSAELASLSAQAHDDFWNEDYAWVRPYVVSGGVLQIPVKGVLLHDFPFQFLNVATGYPYIQKAIERGMNDHAVRGIALIIDSPGGMVAGNFDLVDRIYGARANKPIRAFVNEAAYSAAYSIASAASSIVVARTGGVGSIGVVTSHVDLSKAMDQLGVKITFIHAGKNKVDGHPYAPLSDEVRGRIQQRVDAIYDVFVSTVARNRGLEEQAVRDTEALTFGSADAVSKGLADSIGSLDDAVSAFALEISTIEIGDDEMTTKQNGEAAVDQAAIESARKEGMEAGRKEGLEAGRVEGATAERERINAIMALDESKERREYALTMALTTQLDVEQCKTLLASAPKETKPAEASKADNKSLFAAAMSENNPEIVPEGEGAQSDAERLLASYCIANGVNVARRG